MPQKYVQMFPMYCLCFSWNVVNVVGVILGTPTIYPAISLIVSIALFAVAIRNFIRVTRELKNIRAGIPFSNFPANGKQVRLPPGTLLRCCAEFIYSQRKFQSVLQPTIVDMREEYFEALAAGGIWKSRWVRVRGLWSFWAAVGMDIPISAIGLVKKIWTAAT